ncbi:hypothetical protein EVAR_48061_1 [Eumeta japonica]|uniref:Uncharacterized protein n=1 Tax=Eumeta variegata TaxID=151549 RepID=A0A4C1XA01_EUMVA|nr:hypothetical protein EVAR_48061_1 [Eumeta japonica]
MEVSMSTRADPQAKASLSIHIKCRRVLKQREPSVGKMRLNSRRQLRSSQGPRSVAEIRSYFSLRCCKFQSGGAHGRLNTAVIKNVRGEKKRLRLAENALEVRYKRWYSRYHCDARARAPGAAALSVFNYFPSERKINKIDLGEGAAVGGRAPSPGFKRHVYDLANCPAIFHSQLFLSVLIRKTDIHRSADVSFATSKERGRDPLEAPQQLHFRSGCSPVSIYVYYRNYYAFNCHHVIFSHANARCVSPALRVTLCDVTPARSPCSSQSRGSDTKAPKDRRHRRGDNVRARRDLSSRLHGHRRSDRFLELLFNFSVIIKKRLGDKTDEQENVTSKAASGINPVHFLTGVCATKHQSSILASVKEDDPKTTIDTCYLL